MASIEHRVYASGDEVWRVCYRHDRKQHRVTFDNEDRAQRWKALVEVDVPAALRLLEAPTAGPTVPTVAEWTRRHIDLLTGVTEGTKRDYRSQVAHDLEPHPIGAVRVDALTRADVSAWVNWLQGRGLAGKTIANRHGLLSSSMATAVEAGHAAANPCRGMRLPRTTHTDDEHVYLTRDEFATLLDAVVPHYRPLVLLLAGTGMRFGEATALQVGDVDLARKEIRVRRAWKRTGTSTPELGPTKTRRSTRTVSAPPQVIETLRPLMAGRRPTETLLLSRRGTPIRQAWFWRTVWQPAVWKLAGDKVETREDSRGRPIPVVVEQGAGKHPRIHDLRHTFASWAVQQNKSLPAIQRQLGHESIKTTIDTYSHLARSDFDALSSSMGEMLPPLLEA